MKIKLLSALLSLCFLWGCFPDKSEAEASNQADRLYKIEAINETLKHPWSVAILPDDGFIVTERRGKLWHIKRDGSKREILGVPEVYHEGQGGLLDVIIDNDFEDNKFIFFSYSAQDDTKKANTEVAKAKLNLDQARLQNVEVIFKADPKSKGNNHWGSRLVMTNDNTLIITLGERWDYMDQAQNPENHFGTIVRINKDGSIPSDNPFFNHASYKPSVYSYGHRNPQGLTVHPETREIWSHEHGPKGGDEVNIIQPGVNYGWPEVTFGINYWGTKITDKTTAPGMKDPIHQWTPSIAPSGMAFYTGDQFPSWKNNLFVGALVKKHIQRLEIENNQVIHTEKLLLDWKKRIRDVRNGPDGYLYFLTDENPGGLYRLVPKK